MVKFKRSKNRVSAPAENIVVGGPAAQSVEHTSGKKKLMKGSQISEAGGPVKNPTLVKRFPTQKVLGGITIVALLLIAGVWFFSNKSEKSKVELAKSSLHDDSKKPDYDQIRKNADNIVAEAKTKEEKVEVYRRLASVAASANDRKKAIQYYEAAAQLDESVGQMDAYALAQIYEAEGNNAKAKEKYTLALKYFSELRVESTAEYDYAADNAVYINEIKAKLKQL